MPSSLLVLVSIVQSFAQASASTAAASATRATVGAIVLSAPALLTAPAMASAITASADVSATFRALHATRVAVRTTVAHQRPSTSVRRASAFATKAFGVMAASSVCATTVSAAWHTATSATEGARVRPGGQERFATCLTPVAAAPATVCVSMVAATVPMDGVGSTAR